MNPFESNLWQSDALLSKLFFNETLPGSPEAMLRILGFVHLFSASGIHIYAFLAFLEALAIRFSKKVHLKWMIRAFAFLLIGYLWSLQKYRLGFARPIFTFLIREFARSRGVQWRVFYPLLLTFILDYLFQIDSGRAHYYLAVLGGMMVSEYFLSEDGKDGWRGHFSLAIGSWLATAGIDFFEFHQIAWMTPFYSLITIPLVSLILYPSTALCLLFARPALPFFERVWSWFLDGCLFFAHHTLTFSVVGTRAMRWAGGFSLLAMFFYYFLRSRERVLACLFSGLILLALTIRILFPLEDSILAQLDVHQGDSALIQRQGRTEMIDVGGERVLHASDWILKLSSQGVVAVDGVLLSHLDEDHVGALKKLLRLLPVGCVETNEEHWRSEKGLRFIAKLKAVDPSVSLQSDGCMRLPQVRWIRSTESREDGNGLMAGTVTELNSTEAYFALGDGDQSQELAYEKLFASEISRYPVRFWKVGHHGSRFSSDEGFLKRLNPEEVWISVGKHNPYHHPHVETLWRLSTLRAKMRRTDQEGDIVHSFAVE